MKGVAWIGSASVVVNLLGLASTAILARLLMPGDFGLVAISLAVIAIIGIITEFSLATALVQHENPFDEHFNTAWTLNVLRGVMVALIIALLSWPLADLYGDARLAGILLAMAVTVMVGGFTNPKLVVFERGLQFHQTFIMSLTGKIVGFAVTVGVAYVYRSYWALVIGPLVTEFALAAMSYLLFPYLPRPTLSKYRELLSYSIWLTVGKWVQALNWRSDPLVLGYFFSSALLGQYSMGNRFTGMTIDGVMGPIKRVLFPAFARIRNDAERLRDGYLRSQGVLCMVCFPLSVGIAVVAPELVAVVLGDKWRLAIPIIQVVALIAAMQSSENLNAIAMATGDTKKMFGRDVRAFIVRWPLVLLGVYAGWGDAYGMLVGAVIGRAAAAGVNVGLNMQLISKITSISVADHFAAVWRPAVAAGLMAAVTLAIQPSLPSGTDPVSAALRLAILAGAGAVTYFATLTAIWFARGRPSGIETETMSLALGLIRKFRAGRMRRKIKG